MKKLLVLLLSISLLATYAYGAVGYKKDGVPVASASTIDIQSGYSSFDGSTVTLYTNGMHDGVTTNVSTETNLDSAALAYGVILLQAGSAKSITLSAGTAGQMVSIIMTVYDGKTITLTDDQVSGETVAETGWDDIAFDAVNDQVVLLYVDDTYGWVVIGLYGVAIT